MKKLFKKIKLKFREFIWSRRYTGTSITILDDKWEHDGISPLPPWVFIPREKHLCGRHPEVSRIKLYDKEGLSSGAERPEYSVDEYGTIKVHRHCHLGLRLPIYGTTILINV